mmetsp:Transcript_10775/g.26880  ORF Transcript_10775/g.26880 Transcript_10775/m.26880 type:complete len:207 (-) Transcript_10775:328-948(-)
MVQSAPHHQENLQVQQSAELATHAAAQVRVDNSCVYPWHQDHGLIAIDLVPVTPEDAQALLVLHAQEVRLVALRHCEGEAKERTGRCRASHVTWQSPRNRSGILHGCRLFRLLERHEAAPALRPPPHLHARDTPVPVVAATTAVVLTIGVALARLGGVVTTPATNNRAQTADLFALRGVPRPSRTGCQAHAEAPAHFSLWNSRPST